MAPKTQFRRAAPVLQRARLVANEGGTIVFVAISVGGLERDAGFREEPLSCEQAELLAATWLGEHPGAGTDVPVRFDRVSVLVVGENRAMLRHTVNCLGLPGTTC